jgi:hypothetical protein
VNQAVQSQTLPHDLPRADAGSAERVAALRRKVKRFLPRLKGPWIGVETLALTAAAVGLGIWLRPADPLFLRAEFPWAWFAPVLLALRYGILTGLASSLLLLAAWLWLTPGGMEAGLPKLHFLSGLLLVLVCGEYSGLWRARLRRLAELTAYQEDRVERVTRRLYLLRLSNERLEQNLLARPITLRDALVNLRLSVSEDAEPGPLPGAQQLLDFLAQSCQLEVAALYAMESNEDGQARYLEVARIGEPPLLDLDDPLLAYMTERGELAHIQLDAIDRTLSTPQLVLAPVSSRAGGKLGVLAVNRMPFFALNQDTLQLLTVLLAWYADGVTIRSQAAPVLAAYPQLPIDFAEELVRLIELQRGFGIDSHMVGMVFGEHPLSTDAYEHILLNRRAPDLAWLTEAEERRLVFVNLMPVGGRAAVEGYLLRLEQSLRATFGANFRDLNIRTFSVSLANADPLGTLTSMMQKR